MEAQSESHKRQVVSVFNTVATGYDNAAMRFFSIAADKVIETLKPKSGNNILDIATGTGVVATSCAQAVLPNGQVTAIDLSEAMLEKAIAKANHLGLSNIDFFTMDAERLDFKKNYFDHAICSFGLFFIPDMELALKEWIRVIKPGGSVIFTSFSEDSFMPMVRLFVEQLESFGVKFEDSPIDAIRLSENEQCASLMESAGLKETNIEIQQLGYHLQCANDWWTIVSYSGLRGMLDKLEESQKYLFKTKHLQSIQAMFSEKGLWLNVEVLISQGKVTEH